MRQFKHEHKLQCIGQNKLKSVRHIVFTLAENDQADKKGDQENTR